MARDLSYEFAMPRAVERDLPSVVGMIADSLVALDPNGESRPLTRWFAARMLRDVYEVDDPSKIVDDAWPEDEIETEGVPPEPGPGTGGPDDGRPEPTQKPAPTGPDGKRHPDPTNPLGAKRASDAVEASWLSTIGLGAED